MLNGCIVVNDVEALDSALNGEHRGPILFAENGRVIRIWPSALHREPMRGEVRLLGWFRDVLAVFRSVMGQQSCQTANVV
ncbi:MAG: hypothetical protein V3U10_01255 [Bacteroidota bacterium]